MKKYHKKWKLVFKQLTIYKGIFYRMNAISKNNYNFIGHNILIDLLLHEVFIEIGRKSGMKFQKQLKIVYCKM